MKKITIQSLFQVIGAFVLFFIFTGRITDIPVFLAQFLGGLAVFVGLPYTLYRWLTR